MRMVIGGKFSPMSRILQSNTSFTMTGPDLSRWKLFTFLVLGRCRACNYRACNLICQHVCDCDPQWSSFPASGHVLCLRRAICGCACRRVFPLKSENTNKRAPRRTRDARKAFRVTPAVTKVDSLLRASSLIFGRSRLFVT